MPTGVEDASTIWVNVGSAAALVGATIGATFVGALAIKKGLENAEDLVDADARAQVTGQELQAGQRTRLRAEDVIAVQEQAQKSQEQPAQTLK